MTLRRNFFPKSLDEKKVLRRGKKNTRNNPPMRTELTTIKGSWTNKEQVTTLEMKKTGRAAGKTSAGQKKDGKTTPVGDHF